MGRNHLCGRFFGPGGLAKSAGIRIGGALFALSLCSCAPLPQTPPETSPGEERPLPPRFSIVCVIHGDGDYFYHDPGGNAHRADEEVLRKISGIAARSPRAEVFIFHQKPQTRAWLIFPRRENRAWFYRNGKLMAEKPYRTGRGSARFDPEAELYRRFRSAESPRTVTVFLYFGHEIPEFGGSGYDASDPNRKFTIPDLAAGLKKISGDSAGIDLLVLSTCFSGTPHTIAALSPHARYIIASPENIHLSYFDFQILEQLDHRMRDGDISLFAKEFARKAFDRLSGEVQTAVTVAVYDTDRVQGYLREAGSVYTHALDSLRGAAPAALEHCDCADDSVFLRPEMSEGVEVFYRPPRFGLLKNKPSHSGWECWRRRDIAPAGKE